MKRRAKNYKIKTIHPHLFWTKCDVCANEFKKEDMWRIQYANHFVEICKHCAPSIRDIEKYAESNSTVPIPLVSCGHRNNSNLQNVRPTNFPSPGNPPKL